MSTRVLGIDPGLTRCGVGIVDVGRTRTASLVHVTVIRTSTELSLEQRLMVLSTGIEALLAEYRPSAVALERVFAQHNLHTVMGTAQASGVALLAAARHGLVVGLHTPTEVKAAVSGYGAADKRQVAAMVARILGLDAPPTPADASDALALAICHAWKGRAAVSAPASAQARVAEALTPAQQRWLAAERSAAKSGGDRRLAR
ncbi:MAG: crossover junction endodeoxyribonuclease RuvC [Microbacteriaceae bacterium]